MSVLSHAARGVHMAMSWLTVAPVGSPAEPITVDDGRRVIACAPVVGAVLGLLAAAAAALLSMTALPGLMIGLIVVGVLALATRGMHIDGLADTADGLGSYGDPERATKVMHSGSSGPFAIVTLVVLLGIDAVGIGVLADEHRWYAVWFAVLLSRYAPVIACRRQLRAAPGTRFGELVAGTQRWSILWWLLVLAIAGAPVDADQWWRGVSMTVVAAVVAWAFSAHCARRFGGINGDVLGALVEILLALTLIAVLL